MEKILKSLGFRAFRCQVETCYWRGLLNQNPLGARFKELFQDNLKFILTIIGVILLTLLFYLFVAWQLDIF